MLKGINKINIYTCSNCQNRIITIDRDEGTTPFYMKCPICNEFAESAFYQVNQDLKPEIEWYKPSNQEIEKLDNATKEHVRLGGLLYRKI